MGGARCLERESDALWMPAWGRQMSQRLLRSECTAFALCSPPHDLLLFKLGHGGNGGAQASRKYNEKMTGPLATHSGAKTGSRLPQQLPVSHTLEDSDGSSLVKGTTAYIRENSMDSR